MSNRFSPADLEAFRSVVAEQIGLHFADDKLPLLSELLMSRMRETGRKTVAAYLDVAVMRAEIAELARVLAVSETYFFRDRDQFRAFEALVRAREASPARHLRLLSAGCSSGEEAYSLAVMVRETLQRIEEWTVSILGVDLNPESLEKARAASYSNWSLRETPEPLREKHFNGKGGRYALHDAARAMVRFEQQNLVRPIPGFWREEAFDIIFCRNVLMYFTPAAARQVVAAMARCLSPGGYLFLGHAENLRGVSHDFHLKHSHGTFYYERRASLEAVPAAEAPRELTAKPAPEPIAAVSSDGSWFDAIARASSRIEHLSRKAERGSTKRADRGPSMETTGPRRHPVEDDSLSPAMALMKQERFAEALRLLSSTPATATHRPDALLLRAMLLVSTGDPSGAEDVCSEILEIDDLNAGAHYIMAMCREHAGDRKGSIEHSQTAAYLDSEFAMPHLQLGRLARRAGDVPTARRELGLALGLLSREDAARIVLFGGGFSRETLIELCRGELKACGGDS